MPINALCGAKGDLMSDLKNPYLGPSGEAELKSSVVAFVDILGFKELASSASESAAARTLLDRLRKALREALEHIRLYEKSTASSDSDIYRVRIFTDNVVIAHPIYQDAEMELGLVFTQLAIFQTLLATHGFFVRGGVAIGEATVDEDIVFGPGLVKAYEAESTKARDPRIVLSAEAAKAVQTHLGYYGDKSNAPQTFEYLVDADGQLFINYLQAAFLDDHPRVDLVRSHKKQVENQLALTRNRPSIWSKYAWVASYHNFFCAQNSDDLSTDFQIDMAEFALQPRLIA
jgi:class 3 adenylate cyclase